MKGNFHDMEGKIRLFDEPPPQVHPDPRDEEPIDEHHSVALEVNRIFKDGRVFQNDRILYDEQGTRITNHLVYKDFVSAYTFDRNRNYFLDDILHALGSRLLWRSCPDAQNRLTFGGDHIETQKEEWPLTRRSPIVSRPWEWVRAGRNDSQ